MAHVGATMPTPEARLVETLRRRGTTLALAESMTGGLVCARVSAVPGASEALAGGFVAYTREAKARMLDVREEPVSAAAAEAMAREARSRLGATLGLSVTGFAGPQGREVGLVFLGLADARGARSRRFQLAGDRATIREAAATEAIAWALEAASGETR